jgi:hypothetical protein
MSHNNLLSVSTESQNAVVLSRSSKNVAILSEDGVFAAVAPFNSGFR